MDTSVIIVTFNSGEFIEGCVESVAKNSRTEHEIIVVDNASQDNTREKADISIANDRNWGFARAINQGRELATGKHLVLLNPDVVVPGGWDERLAGYMQGQVAAVGPVASKTVGTQGFSHQYRVDPAEYVQKHYSGQTQEVGILIGFALMLRADVFDAAGGLDDGFFLGRECADLCWRIREAGWKCVVAKDVFVNHFGHHSFKSTNTVLMERSSQEHLHAKLVMHFGPQVPDPAQLWGETWIQQVPLRGAA